jgi:hypothetical protein
MANQFLDETVYANAMLLLVKNHLVMGKIVDTKYTNDVTDKNGLQIYVKRPPRFVVGDGPALSKQDIVTGSTSVKVDQYKHVHLGITDLQYVQSYNQLMRTQTMRSAASALAQGVDSYLQGMIQKFPSWVNAPGSAGSADLPFATVQQEIPVWSRLENLAVPSTDRCGVMNTNDAAGIQGSLIDKFMQQEAVNALKKARIPMLSDIDYYRTQATSTLTTGTRSSTAGAIDGADQNVDYEDVKDSMTQTLVVDTLTNGHTIAAGEVFTIANVFRVNPRTGQVVTSATGAAELMQFTVVNAATVAGGEVALTISPAIIVPGTGASLAIQRVNTAFATASAVPADGALITFVGAPSSSFAQRGAWHKSAIQLVSARLIMPDTGVASYAQDEETGISIRYWRGSDITSGEHIHRWDMIYGATVTDPLLGTRFSGLSLT